MHAEKLTCDCREAAALSLATIGWSATAAKTAIFEAIASVGLRLHEMRLGSGRCVMASPVIL